MHAKGALPGSNGSDSRANCASAGLILVMIGNGLQILLAPLTGNGAVVADDGKDLV